MQDYWQQQQNGPESIDSQQDTMSNGKRPSMNHHIRDSSNVPVEKKPNYLSLTSLEPTIPSHQQRSNSTTPSAFHTLPTPQHVRGSPAPPHNYYFGCHPSQNSTGEVNADGSSRSLHPSKLACYAQQCLDQGGMNNEELDKSEDLIYESIYDSRWRLLNQVNKIRKKVKYFIHQSYSSHFLPPIRW